MLDQSVLDSIDKFVRSLPKVSGYKTPKPDIGSCWLYIHQRPLELADVFERLIGLTGWTKQELARRIGVTPQTVSKVLAGTQKGLTTEVKRSLEAACMPYPDLCNSVRGMTLRGPGRPPTIERI